MTDNKTDDFSELVQTLKSRNVAVFLVSGGFRHLINPVAEKLGIPQENIYANKIFFENGTFRSVL